MYNIIIGLGVGVGVGVVAASLVFVVTIFAIKIIPKCKQKKGMT